MDARDLLRKYIEQRREAGETELVLDGLQVDEVMRLVGAAGKGLPAHGSPRSGRTAENTGSDWRVTLRDAGVTAEAPVAPASVSPPLAASVEGAPEPAQRVGRLDFVP